MLSSSSGNLNLGLVQGLRATATTERLRSDHILTLELMQETADENASLKEINKKLLARLNALDGGNVQVDVGGGITDAASMNDKDKDKDTAQIIQRVLKQDKEIGDLKTENKLLKLRSSQDDKQLREMQRKLASYEAMRRELESFKEKSGGGSGGGGDADSDTKGKGICSKDGDESRLAQIQALQEECTRTAEMYKGHMSTCSATLEQVQLSHAAAIDQQNKKFEADIAQLQDTIQNLLSVSKAASGELHTVQGQLEMQVSKYKDLRRMADQGEQALQDRLHAARIENSSLTSQISELQTQVGSLEETKRQLEDRINALQRELAKHLTTAAASSLRNPLLLQPQVDANASGGGGGFFLTTTADRTSDKARDSMESEPESIVESGSGGGGAHFAEFVQLRKENKALKLQLLELSSRRKSANGSGSGSGSGSLGRAY
jgi:hypothetical protein